MLSSHNGQHFKGVLNKNLTRESQRLLLIGAGWVQQNLLYRFLILLQSSIFSLGSKMLKMKKLFQRLFQITLKLYPSIPRVLTHSNEKQHYLAIKNFLSKSSQSSCQCWMFERADLKEWHSGQMIQNSHNLFRQRKHRWYDLVKSVFSVFVNL